MFDSHKIQLTHPLYKQFADWQGVDGYLDNNYHMLNYSLHAATGYMEAVLGIDLYLDNKTINAKDIKDFNVNKVLSVQSASGLLLPSIEYVDSTTGSIVTVVNDYTYSTLDKLKDAKVNTVTGYLFKTPVDYSEVEYSGDIARPTVSLANKTRLVSPYLVDSTENTLDIIVYGKVGASVEINDVAVGTIEENLELATTLSLVGDSESFRIKLVDQDLNTSSDPVQVLVVKVPNYNDNKYLTILGYDTVVSAADIRVVVTAPVDSEVTINNTTTAITSDVQVINVPKAVDALGNIKPIQVLKYSLTGSPIKGTLVSKYIAGASEDYIDAINTDTLTTPYLPYDLQVAMFKLAKHLYSGTLYNSSNVETAQSLSGDKVTYMSHSIPKDVTALLSPYIRY